MPDPDSLQESELEPSGAEALTTPFRAHLAHCQALSLPAQLEECADYIHHVGLLASEFLESYYLVERLWEPEIALNSGYGAEEEFVLEPFYDSLELTISDQSASERLVCVSGAVSPLPGDRHPALSRRGLDFVGLRDGEARHIVLGVAQDSKDETPFMLLIRALNGLAELSPPLRVVQLGRDILRAGIPEDARFSLQIGVAHRDDSPTAVALAQLTRDLAEAFILRASRVDQLAGMFDEIACIEIDPASLERRVCRRLWRTSAESAG